MSDLSHAPLEIPSSIHTNTGFLLLKHALVFLPFAQDVLPFYTWELSYNFQDPDQTSLDCETIPEPVTLGSPNTRPLSFLVPSSICCMFIYS